MVNANEMSKEMIAALSFSESEKKSLDEAKEKPIIFDTDCPETTPEQALKFKRVNPPRTKIEKRA